MRQWSSRESAAAAPRTGPAGPLGFESGAATHPGAVRARNEDACLARPESGIWAVADGMGGHAAGDVASGLVVERLAALAPEGGLEQLVSAAEEALIAVNHELVQLAVTERKNTIGTTAAVLLAAQHHVICLWAGDSRIYRWRHGEFEQLTQDHAMVEEMVQVGLLNREDAERHPQANRITRAIGATGEVFLDMEIYRLQPGDAFLLCTDGLYRELAEDELAAGLADDAPPGVRAENLVERAVNAGARDNVTAVVVQVAARAE